MNDNHSNRDLFYKKRWITSSLHSAIKEHRIVVLTGPRQVGKSTLLTNEAVFSDWKYLSLDDFNLLAQAESEPTSLWIDSEKIILDEVQKAPRLLSAIKQTVDRGHLKKRFILSGSANLLLMHKIGESLAGRAVYFPLYPMTLGEMKELPQPDILLNLFKGKFPKPGVLNKLPQPYPFMVKGFMPALLTLKTKEGYLRWWEGYIATYLERDLRQLSQVESLPEFRRVMEVAALRSGQLINQTEIARDVGVGQATVYRYLNLLETTCLLRRIPAYAKSRTRRLIKSPKVYFIDPGLTSFLCGYFDADSLNSAKEAGSIFEAMVLLHLTVLCELMVPKAKIFYWRTVSGQEIDFVLEYGKRLIAIEVKLSSSVNYEDIKGIRFFLEEYAETSTGIVIYTGNEIKYLGKKVLAIPWIMFAGVDDGDEISGW